MAIAKFHSLRGESNKSALILIKANEFVFGWTPVYVPRTPFVEMVPNVDTKGNPVLGENGQPEMIQQVKPSFLKENFTFNIPDGYKLTPMVNEDGTIRTSSEGHELRQLTY